LFFWLCLLNGKFSIVGDAGPVGAESDQARDRSKGSREGGGVRVDQAQPPARPRVHAGQPGSGDQEQSRGRQAEEEARV